MVRFAAHLPPGVRISPPPQYIARLCSELHLASHSNRHLFKYSNDEPGTCQGGKCVVPVVCGNGLIQGSEECECASGTNCRFCTNCKLAHGKECTPDSASPSCCDSQGMAHPTSKMCTTWKGRPGYCANGVCTEPVCNSGLNTGLGEMTLDVFCGVSTNRGPCYAKCHGLLPPDFKTYGNCIDTSERLKERSVCEENGRRGTCRAGKCQIPTTTTTTTWPGKFVPRHMCFDQVCYDSARLAAMPALFDRPKSSSCGMYASCLYAPTASKLLKASAAWKMGSV